MPLFTSWSLSDKLIARSYQLVIVIIFDYTVYPMMRAVLQFSLLVQRRCSLITALFVVISSTKLIGVGMSDPSESTLMGSLFKGIWILISFAFRTVLRFGLTTALVASIVITLHAAGQLSKQALQERKQGKKFLSERVCAYVLPVENMSSIK